MKIIEQFIDELKADRTTANEQYEEFKTRTDEHSLMCASLLGRVQAYETAIAKAELLLAVMVLDDVQQALQRLPSEPMEVLTRLLDREWKICEEADQYDQIVDASQNIAAIKTVQGMISELSDEKVNGIAF